MDPNSRLELEDTKLTREELIDALADIYARTKTTSEIAAARGISTETVRRMVDKGQLHYVRLGRDVRVWADA